MIAGARTGECNPDQIRPSGRGQRHRFRSGALRQSAAVLHIDQTGRVSERAGRRCYRCVAAVRRRIRARCVGGWRQQRRRLYCWGGA